MAFDFTLSTGSRDSRSRRSQSSVQQTTQTSTNRQVAREAPTVAADPGTDPLIQLSENMGKFFGQMSQKETLANLQKEKDRNDQALVEAKRRVLENPEGAREAIRSNDFSGFVEDDELRTRKYVIDGFMKVAGASAAQMEWAEKGEQFISGLSAEQDPVMEWQKYLAGKIEGTNPLYSDQYFQTAMKLAGPSITKFQNARYNHMVDTAKDNAHNILTEALKQERVNPSGNFSLEAVADTAYSGVPIPAPLRESLKRDTMGTALRLEAARGNRMAMDIYKNERINPMDPASPTWDTFYTNKGQPFYKVQEAFHEKDREEVWHQTSQDIERITNDYRMGNRTTGEIIGALSYWIHDEGVSPQNDRIMALQKLAAQQLKDTSVDRMMIDVLSKKRALNSISPSDASDVTKWLDMHGMDVSQWAEAVGIPVGQAQKRVDDLLANGYASDKLKNQMASFLFDSGVDTKVRMEQLHKLTRFSNQALHKVLPAGKADQVIAFVDLYRGDPQTASNALRKITDAMEQGRNITAYHQYDKSYTDRKFKDDVDRKFGSRADTMDPGSWKRIVGVANMLAISMGNATDGINAAEAMFSKDNLQAIREADGSTSYRIPDQVGTVMNKEQLDAANNSLQSKVGDGLYVSGTSGAMKGVQVHESGQGRPMSFIPGSDIPRGVWIEKGGKIPPQYEGFMKSTTSDGRIKLEVPPAPKEGESNVRDIGNDMYMIFEGGTWNVRYDDQTDLKSENPPPPPNADAATSMLHKRLTDRKSVEDQLDKLEATPTKTVAGMRVGQQAMHYGKINELSEKKAKLDAQITELSSVSGTNAMAAKMLKDWGVANGDTPELKQKIEELEVDPTPPTKTAQVEDLMKFVANVTSGIRQKKRVANHAEIEKHQNSFESLAMPHIIKHESFRAASYEDGKYKDENGVWQKNRSIAYGWSLRDEDVVKILTGRGYNIKELWDGKDADGNPVQIDQNTANSIMPEIWNLRREWTVDQVGTGVWQHLSDKQRLSLVSLAYNARRLIGDGLKEGLDMYATAKEQSDEKLLKEALTKMNFEVRHNSLPFQSYIDRGMSNVIDGLQKRRNAEADLLMDGYLKDKDGKNRFPARFVDWKTKFLKKKKDN